MSLQTDIIDVLLRDTYKFPAHHRPGRIHMTHYSDNSVQVTRGDSSCFLVTEEGGCSKRPYNNSVDWTYE